jgi:hypothetical protein
MKSLRYVCLLTVLNCFDAVESPAASPSILITNVPPFGSFENLAGTVSNAVPADFRVAVFIYVPGAGWFTKPYCAQPLTVIQPNASWTTDVTTGGSDERATKIAALLVGTNYNEPCVLGLPALPTNVLQQAKDQAIVTRDDPNVRRFDFSGVEWLVKSSSSPVGPGPNLFSDTINNVWLDTQGRLHLRIANQGTQWQCAEIFSRRSFGHGLYRFYIDSVINNFDPGVVFGLLTYSDDPAFAHREIDFEFSRWDNAADPNNAQFVVQPFDTPNHLLRYRVPAGMAASTHSFKWETNRITFQSLSGHFAVSPGPTNVIRQWTYTSQVPLAGDEVVHLNLWLINGNPPANGNEAEVVVTRFEFVPPGDPQPANFTRVEAQTDGTTHLSLDTQPDRRYDLQISTNLFQWQSLGELLATNSVTVFTDTNAVPDGLRFYRALTLP